MSKFKWVNLYAMAQAEGFAYFKAYVNESTNQAVGWITRYGLKLPYAYNVYWIGTDGNVISDTRGTWQHADYAVEGAVASLSTKSGIALVNKIEPQRGLEIYRRIKAVMRHN